jgi:hypothetical protein
MSETYSKGDIGRVHAHHGMKRLVEPTDDPGGSDATVDNTLSASPRLCELLCRLVPSTGTVRLRGCVRESLYLYELSLRDLPYRSAVASVVPRITALWELPRGPALGGGEL